MFQFASDVRGYIEDAIGIGRGDTMEDNDPSRTGAAVRGKKRPSDVGTFPYIDNVHRFIAHLGRIVNSMLPEVYDSPRDVRVMLGDEEETISHMPVNMPYAEAQKRMQGSPELYKGIDLKALEPHVRDEPKAKYNDLGKGEYDVIIKVGPPFSTAREETEEKMLQLAIQGKTMNPVDKYYAVKNMSLADGGEYAETLRRMIPPHIMPPKPGEPERPPMPVPPQMQLLMAKAETEKLKQQAMIMKAKESILKIAEASKDTDKEIRKIALQAIADVLTPGQPGGGK